MSIPEIERLRKLYAEIDAGRLCPLEGMRAVVALQKQLSAPQDLEAAQRLSRGRLERLEAERAERTEPPEADSPRGISAICGELTGAAGRAFRPAAQRRRWCATARAWCLQSGIAALRDLTAFQSQIAVEVLRKCLRTAHRSSYLTYGQIAKLAGCSRGTAITAMRLLTERGLFHVRRRRVSADRNAPNLYIPCRHLVRALGPFVVAFFGIGVQRDGPLGNNSKQHLSPTSDPTSTMGRKKNGVAPDERAQAAPGATGSRAPETFDTRPSRPAAAAAGCSGGPEAVCGGFHGTPPFNRAEKAALLKALPAIDGIPVGKGLPDAELVARIERIRSVLLPEISADFFARHRARAGLKAAGALLATVLKRHTRTTEPIRKPAAYYTGTVKRALAGRGDPFESLASVLEVHTAQADPTDIPAAFRRRVEAVA